MMYWCDRSMRVMDGRLSNLAVSLGGSFLVLAEVKGIGKAK